MKNTVIKIDYPDILFKRKRKPYSLFLQEGTHTFAKLEVICSPFSVNDYFEIKTGEFKGEYQIIYIRDYRVTCNKTIK